LGIKNALIFMYDTSKDRSWTLFGNLIEVLFKNLIILGVMSQEPRSLNFKKLLRAT